MRDLSIILPPKGYSYHVVHGHLITESYHKLHGHPQIQIGHDGILYCQAYIKTWIEVKLQYEVYGHCHHITTTFK